MRRVRVAVVTDVHLAPPGTPASFCHNVMDYATAEARLGRGLELCLTWGVDAVLLLGDLTTFGDDPCLERGIHLLERSGVPAWIVPGNHDLTVRDDALKTVERIAARRVRAATGAGELLAPGVRLAGILIEGREAGTGAAVASAPPVEFWGADLVLWLSHYPMLSMAGRMERAGFEHQGDVEAREVAAAPLLRRSAPTLVLCGHHHARDACLEGPVLQVAGAALVEAPAEIAVVDVERDADEARVRRRVLSLGQPDAERSPVLVGDDLAWRYNSESRTWQASSPSICKAQE